MPPMQWLFDIVIEQMEKAGFITWPQAKAHVEAEGLDFIPLPQHGWIGRTVVVNRFLFHSIAGRELSNLTQADLLIDSDFRLGVGTLPGHPLHVIAAEIPDYTAVMIETVAGQHCYTQLKSPTSGKNVGLLFALAGDFKWRVDYQTAGAYFTFFSYPYGSAVLNLMDNGDVVSPPTYGNVVGGTNHALFIDNTGKIGQQPSSESVKENVRPLDKSEDVHQLAPVRFNCAQGGRLDQPGLIAEQVAEVMPELVDYKRVPVYGDIVDPVSGDTIQGVTHYETTDQPEAVRYDDLIPHLLKEIQTLRTQVDWLLENQGATPPW